MNAKCLAVVVNVNASEKIMRHVAVGADGQDGRDHEQGAGVGSGGHQTVGEES